ncbi:hypothetical protein [Glutamicibacter sp. X7]
MADNISTVNIGGKEHPKIHMDHLKRGQIQGLKPLLEKLNESQDLEVAWDIIPVLFPGVSQEEADDLTIGECKKILSDAGIASFDDPNAKPESAPQNAEITLGESSASTNS